MGNASSNHTIFGFHKRFSKFNEFSEIHFGKTPFVYHSDDTVNGRKIILISLWK